MKAQFRSNRTRPPSRPLTQQPTRPPPADQRLCRSRLKDRKSGELQVGKITIHGLEISIENPKGSKRTGTDKDGEQWEQTMRHHYGCHPRKRGKDKDHVDVFIGPEAEREQPKGIRG